MSPSWWYEPRGPREANSSVCWEMRTSAGASAVRDLRPALCLGRLHRGRPRCSTPAAPALNARLRHQTRTLLAASRKFFMRGGRRGRGPEVGPDSRRQCGRWAGSAASWRRPRLSTWVRRAISGTTWVCRSAPRRRPQRCLRRPRLCCLARYLHAEWWPPGVPTRHELPRANGCTPRRDAGCLRREWC